MHTHPSVAATYCHCIALVTPYHAQNCTKKTSSSPSLILFLRPFRAITPPSTAVYECLCLEWTLMPRAGYMDRGSKQALSSPRASSGHISDDEGPQLALGLLSGQPAQLPFPKFF